MLRVDTFDGTKLFVLTQIFVKEKRNIYSAIQTVANSNQADSSGPS